jgi:hypothetical protein
VLDLWLRRHGADRPGQLPDVRRLDLGVHPASDRGRISVTPAELASKVTEHDAVRRWRSEQLQLAGYPPTDALVLSRRPDVDVHRATGLLRKGCPVDTAVRILI